MADVYISSEDLRRAFKDLNRIAKHYRNDNWRRETMANAAQVVANAARKRQGKSDAIHYYYKNTKKGIRRSPGSAIQDRVKIMPGNLKTSIQYLSNLKKTTRAIIGPRIKNRIGNLKTLGRSQRNSSGFYAWMAKKSYKGAEDFRRDIMEPALAQNASKIISYVDRQTARHTDKIRNQLSLFR